jgi:hypothetical protein
MTYQILYHREKLVSVTEANMILLNINKLPQLQMFILLNLNLMKKN